MDVNTIGNTAVHSIKLLLKKNQLTEFQVLEDKKYQTMMLTLDSLFHQKDYFHALRVSHQLIEEMKEFLTKKRRKIYGNDF